MFKNGPAKNSMLKIMHEKNSMLKKKNSMLKKKITC